MADGSQRRRILAAVAAGVFILGLPASAGAASGRASGFTAQALTPTGSVTGFKSPSSRLAQTDPSLLGRTDSTKVHVMIKLDYDPTASYAGGVDGLAPTSPDVTGHRLTGKSAAERAYGRYQKQQRVDFAAALKSAVPSAAVGESFDVVFGGVAATIPANSVAKVAALPDVVAVQADTLAHPLTDASPKFLDAPPVYAEQGSTANAGAGLIFGDLDTGVWPEHPSFADLGNLSAPPGTYGCNFGDNPLTPANDPFVCNHKLIGGVWETQTYDAVYNGTAGADPYAGTARDGDGHGTHTSSTAAGDIVDSAPVLGVDRGPIHGLAPGAWIIEYKVCGPQGCYGSDSARAVEQAILDGVNVINFSISGGANPFSDPVELAFLDAYNAGVFVAASAGNGGPGAGTSDHLSPWVTTVAASTETREFATTLTLTAGGDTFTADGASITMGAGPATVVLAQDIPGYGDPLCASEPPASDTFAGMIVACQRGTTARAWKGFVVYEGGGEGMILYNPSLADVETDNHWVPTVHLADGTDFVAFMAAHAGDTVTGSFPNAEKRNGQGDVMAAFSSRGPGGLFIKPDVTAPGVEILAGNTPTPPVPDADNGAGPAGEYYQAIAGTSMSSPHVAGAALLVKAVHPSWSPGEIKSALMTTATTKVVKEDLTTPADPFDFGAGRIDIGAAASAPLVLDESASDFYAMGGDPVQAIQLNVPSIDAPVLPGRIETSRTVTNVSGKNSVFNVATSAPTGSTISVSPSHFALRAGRSQRLRIVIETEAPVGAQQFGAISISTSQGGFFTAHHGFQHRTVTQHLPVAFIHTQGAVNLTQDCSPTSISLHDAARCDVSVTNNSFDTTSVSADTSTNGNLDILGATGARVRRGEAQIRNVTLAGAQPGVPSRAAGITPNGSTTTDGFLDLSLFGVGLTPIGDEQILNYGLAPFVYDGQTWNRIGVDSNGYLIVGGSDSSQDNECCNIPSGPDPARPNNVIAPLWTDLNGTAGDGTTGGIRVAGLTGGGFHWTVFQYEVYVYGTTDLRKFQVWVGTDGVQDITWAFDSYPQADPAGQPFLVGAENQLGQGDMQAVLPTTDSVITSTDPIPGESATYSVFVRGVRAGTGVVKTEMTATGVPGVTIERSTIAVQKQEHHHH